MGSLRWSGKHTKIYIGEVPSGEGGSSLNGGRINTIGLYRGPHAQPTLGNPEYMDRALNQRPKILRKETVLNKSQEF